MRTLATVALATMMTIASSCPSSCSSRQCVDAMDAYARAAEFAPHDEADHAYDDFVAIAARSPKDGDGNCRAVAALAARVASVRTERAVARSSAGGTVKSHASKAESQATADSVAAAAADPADGDDPPDDTAADAAANDHDEDEDENSARSFSVASSPHGVVLPVNVARAVARAEASSSTHACVARCGDDQRVCLGRCDKKWKASGSLREYRDCQSGCSDVEVKCRRECKPRRAADAGPE